MATYITSEYTTGLIPITEPKLRELGAVFVTPTTALAEAYDGHEAWNPADEDPNRPGVDWRRPRSLVGNTSALGPVRGQGLCGACFMMTAISFIEAWVAISTATKPVPLDDNQFIKCAFDPRNPDLTHGQCGGWESIEYANVIVSTMCRGKWLASNPAKEFMFFDDDAPEKTKCDDWDSCQNTKIPWPSCLSFKSKGVKSCSNFIPEWRRCNPTEMCSTNRDDRHQLHLPPTMKIHARALETSLTRQQREAEMSTLLRVFGPFPVSILMDFDWPRYNSGLLVPKASAEKIVPPVNHEVLLVGDVVDKKYGQMWIVQNSWGTQWGLNGFAYISKNTDAYGKLGAFNILYGPIAYIE